jgi:hypothetical protein
LVTARYDTDVEAGPFEQMGIQFIFNPNVDFIPSIYNVYGNDQAGIWALDLELDNGFSVGRNDLELIEDPDSFDSDYFEYGMKISGNTQNSIYSLMGFYGINNWASETPLGLTDDSFKYKDTDDHWVVNMRSAGFYPREKFVGASWSTILPISASVLGGFRPMLDLEVSYRFDDVFLDQGYLFNGEMYETDTLVAGAGIIWKMKVPWQKGFISFMANAVYTRYENEDVVLYAPDYAPRQEWWNCFFDINTSYKRWDLAPGIWVYTEQNGDIVQIAPYIAWWPNSTWSFYLSGAFFTGPEKGTWGLDHKDSIALKVTYQF